MQEAGAVETGRTLLTADDLYLFNEGTHSALYDKLGAHHMENGAHFAVWAPNARLVSAMGDFNAWNRESHLLQSRGQSGIWEGFIPGVKRGMRYNYHIASRYRDYRTDRPDPYGLYYEPAPRGASIVWDLDYAWGDDDWMQSRRQRNSRNAPIAIYEVHLGSWGRVPEEGDRFLSYRELAEHLTHYVTRMGFTHVEFLPVMEHPFYGSWGYYAPTSRYGMPQDFMYLIDRLHQARIGVILDWVPSHFNKDEHGLVYFDGTGLYEHASALQGKHPEWDSCIFNYGRNEVRSFLISNAAFWLDKYHADALRVDAVASMLYLDYARRPGEWVPNQHGGRENLEAIDFLRRFNAEAYRMHPDIQTFAEDSTSWPMVSHPVYVGGLGFGFKWDMGWMHDMLDYLSLDPIHRKYHHDRITFRMMYAFSENYTLPLSHDEVVHRKRSLLEKIPGDDWQKFATLRLLYGYMYTQPGKKLLFMGGEFGQRREWNHDASLDWHLTQYPLHAGLQTWVSHLNDTYRREPALHELDCDSEGFRWVDCSDAEHSVVSYLRRSSRSDEVILVACNFTPVPQHNYRIGVPCEGYWSEVLNSDAREYGGSGQGNTGGVEASPVGSHGFYNSLNLTLPPLGIVVFRQPRRESNRGGGVASA
jgi:1,4-alpha-glucan branching enzyme